MTCSRLNPRRRVLGSVIDMWFLKHLTSTSSAMEKKKEETERSLQPFLGELRAFGNLKTFMARLKN